MSDKTRVCNCDKRPDRQAGRPGINPATGQRWTWDTLPTCKCPEWEPLDPTLAEAIRGTVGWLVAETVYETRVQQWMPEIVGSSDIADAVLDHLLEGAP